MDSGASDFKDSKKQMKSVAKAKKDRNNLEPNPCTKTFVPLKPVWAEWKGKPRSSRLNKLEQQAAAACPTCYYGHAIARDISFSRALKRGATRVGSRTATGTI